MEEFNRLRLLAGAVLAVALAAVPALAAARSTGCAKAGPVAMRAVAPVSRLRRLSVPIIVLRFSTDALSAAI